MSFDHDSFIGLQNYQDLDSLLDWYISLVGPKRKLLKALGTQNLSKLKILYSRDPVLQKLRIISKTMERILAEADP